MPEKFKIYIKIWVCLTLALLILIAGFNWLVDPYNIYNSPKIEGFNVLKPEVSSHERILKAYAVNRIKPDTICLGTSRAEVGIDPNYPGWLYPPVYNLGLSSASIYEIMRYFQHANFIHPLKRVLLCLDFFSFNTEKKNTGDFNENLLNVNSDNQPNSKLNIDDKMSTLISGDALISSFNTIRQEKPDSLYLDNGMRVVDDSYVKNGYHETFVNSDKDSTGTPEQYQFDTAGVEDSPFTYYRNILKIAYSDNIDLRMVISPSHVRQWELMAAEGLWPKLEYWKRSIVKINEEEAKNFRKSPFPLWDFSLYNEYTTESIPAAGDTKTMMLWYWDSSHFKKELGDLMLDRVYGFSSVKDVSADNFGVLLNSQNIDSRLRKIWMDHQSYAATHPGEIYEVKQIASLGNAYHTPNTN